MWRGGVGGFLDRMTTRLVLENDVQGVDDAGDVWHAVLAAAESKVAGRHRGCTYNQGWSRAS